MKSMKNIKMMKRINNNEGFSSVLILTILASIALSIILIYKASVNIASTAEANSAFRLAGRSILSEYDKKLKRDYSLYGFKGDEKDIVKKLKAYSNVSFKKRNVISSIASFGQDESHYIKPKANNIDANLKEYSLIDIENFKNQIVKNQRSFHGLLESATTQRRAREDEASTEYRVLRNDIVKEGLPSYGLEEDMNFLESFGQDIASKIEDIGNIDNFFENGIADSVVNIYMFSHFNSSVYQVTERETFFHNELEYILQGGFDDKKNKDNVYRKILFIRAALNTVHITTNAEKMQLVSELATAGLIIGPEGQALAEVAIIAAWAMAEAENDVKLLKDGEKVPFIKSSANFALTSPKKAIDGAFSDKTVKPRIASGQEYYDYLRVLLLTKNENDKILRMMDLIQINMKNNYNENFLLREHYAGFRMSMEVGNDEISYDQKY